uniref:Uncharacterized protein n=1 Tax=Romanomermis culicivorax TaxID=13658 RepID=A0A915IZ39_ROMCU
MITSMFNHVAYYPTLLFNVLRNKAGPTDWPWYSRIDNNVILGALPTKSMLNELIEKEKVGAVVCMTMPHEVNNFFAAGRSDFEKLGVKYYACPSNDFNPNLKARDVHEAVKFIRQFENTDKSVYVHCKAGRARSAVTVMCYVMERYKYYSPAAYTMIKPKRPQIALKGFHWNLIEFYAKSYLWNAMNN